MMEFDHDTDPSEHKIYILWCQKPKHEDETLSRECYSRRSILSNFSFMLSCNGIEHFNSKVSPPLADTHENYLVSSYK